MRTSRPRSARFALAIPAVLPRSAGGICEAQQTTIPQAECPSALLPRRMISNAPGAPAGECGGARPDHRSTPILCPCRADRAPQVALRSCLEPEKIRAQPPRWAETAQAARLWARLVQRELHRAAVPRRERSCQGVGGAAGREDRCSGSGRCYRLVSPWTASQL